MQGADEDITNIPMFLDEIDSAAQTRLDRIEFGKHTTQINKME